MVNSLVSILIPFKNVEDYFEECLKSIQNQTYKNWEVIAVNDNSSDNSVQIANQFATEDHRFKIFSNDKSGIITALRKACQHSTGGFISRMDADDHMTKDRIKVMVESLVNEGQGTLAVGKVKYFSKAGVKDGYERYEKWLNKLTATGENFKEIYKECVIPSPCWMVHKSDFDKCGAFMPDRYPEDYDLAFRFYEFGLTCIPCSTTLHYWRDYDNRTSRTSEHYAQNYFLDIKLHYFLKLEFKPSNDLVVWGAGKKGKTIANSLVEKNIPFSWVCDNEKKIGKDIYGVRLQHFSELQNIENIRCIITVANERDQMSITAFFKELNLKPAVDYFFFC
ncbi:glycosyltransferase involved in cell wall biosynthesis [Maribacter caenipelagi]|uniref:Glycosyltransferase involved in cell wall biosynthesis n=1 Tax=Maribacter caenipelagi TaxID=1447781 RepID=A0A4R7D1V3_9FLAO|nr:glycosyltransferase family 2 protein [Maribacter caenipelagi]TDS13534.1 glycosyltransferase involved in cell wall biosynthesis [Maribacter caenipelagi]